MPHTPTTMKPRSLRHRLEKAAKVLIFIQKHTPDVNCTLDVDKGAHGQIIIDFAEAGVSQSKLVALGKELESKGYNFTKRSCPWLGQTTYLGRADDKPNVAITLPMTKDRLAINEDSPEVAYSFANA
jgi:hypothetical protein